MTAQGPKRRNNQLSPRVFLSIKKQLNKIIKERKRANFRGKRSTLGESVDSAKSYQSQYSTTYSTPTNTEKCTDESSSTQTTYTTRANPAQ